MNLVEMSVAARMCGMSYGQYAFLLRQDRITPPSLEAVHKNMKHSKGTRVCAECGKTLIAPTGTQLYCNDFCKRKHAHKKRKGGGE